MGAAFTQRFGCLMRTTSVALPPSLDAVEIQAERKTEIPIDYCSLLGIFHRVDCKP